MSERVDDYDYDVPPGAAAQVPAARREDARLLHLDRAADPARRLDDRPLCDLPDLLRSGDLLVLNETWVAPARLLARRETGGRVSVLVLVARPRTATVLLGARGTPLPGERLDVAGDTWRIERALGEGRFDVAVESGRDPARLMADEGRMPLPPYIARDPEQDARDALDRERYQTVYARSEPPGREEGGWHAAVAAPTAGLHLTPALLEAIEARGVRLGRLRLDVGEGTFRPLRGETLDEHVMHAERYVVPEALARDYAATRAAGGRVVSVGTTVVRALESAVSADGAALQAGEGVTELFIRPGHRFAAVDALLTNFHQPRSTLLVLVSAFAGKQAIAAAYRHAIVSGYRLFSYGDAMFIA
jgi:S-adenosylmethionine:tRNA ribosyltransferase-isomerase